MNMQFKFSFLLLTTEKALVIAINLRGCKVFGKKDLKSHYAAFIFALHLAVKKQLNRSKCENDVSALHPFPICLRLDI
jgi:hypothetical protein